MFKATVREYLDIRKHLKELLEGLVISIDPSVGSTSSMPGWAVSRKGKIIGSGTFSIDAGKSLPDRLRAVGRCMVKLYKDYPPDLLVYEEIAPRRYGGGSAHGHASLLKAVGVVLSVPGPTSHIGLRPTQWKRQVRDSYVKGDEADAIEMLYIAIETARYIAEEDPPRSYGGKRVGKSATVSKGRGKTKAKLIGETVWDGDE